MYCVRRQALRADDSPLVILSTPSNFAFPGKPLMQRTAPKISERKRIEDAIRLSEARLKRAELAVKSGNRELHLDSGTMIGSAGATELFGLDLAKADSATIKKLLPPEYIPLHEAFAPEGASAG